MKESHQFVIVGAGPAGLQLAYDLDRAGRSYVLLERGAGVGNFFRTFPRRRTLISINKRYTGYDDPEINLRWDWNSVLGGDGGGSFTNYSKDYFPQADDLVRYLVDYAEHNRLDVRCNTEVTRIRRSDEGFELQTRDGATFAGQVLVMATGVWRPYIPPIEGIEYAEPYTTMSVDPDDYLGQRVLIIGKGNSGFETADTLVSTTAMIHIVSPQPVVMAWKTKFVGHLRALNNNFIDTYQLKSQNVILDADVERIEREGDEYVVSFRYSHAAGEIEQLRYDRILACTGFCFDASVFDDSCRPSLVIDERFPAQTSAWEAVGVPGLYFAGAVMQMRDYQQKQSAFIHGFRYNVRALFRHLERRYQGVPWPARVIEPEPQTLADAILARANRSSGLWQQTGALCDLLTVGSDGVRYHEDVATDYAHETLARGHGHYYVITLEFGLELIAAAPDPLAIERIHKDDVERADQSTGIHPIVRRYCEGTLVAEHHVIEDVLSEWKEPVHVEPLRAWLEAMLASEPAQTRPVVPSTVGVLP
ncbi:MAG: NAD(P)-binding domain-containing protein [Myxococcota bacterium]